jgi:hypothetical protein
LELSKLIWKMTKVVLAAVFSLSFLFHMPLLGQNLFLCGASGGPGGDAFIDDAIPKNSRVSEIHIHAGEYIDAVRLVHENSRGEILELRKNGGPGGTQFIINLEPDEYIIAVEGRHNSFVHALKFYTNKRETSWYGGTGGQTNFKYEAPEGYEIVGLNGRATQYVDALGVLMRRR